MQALILVLAGLSGCLVRRYSTTNSIMFNTFVIYIYIYNVQTRKVASLRWFLM